MIAPLLDQVQIAEETAIASIDGSVDLKSLELSRQEIFGKKGALRQFMKSMGSLPEGERPAAGQAINEALQRVELCFEEKRSRLASEHLNARLEREQIDITLPGTPETPRGGLHPLTQTLAEMQRILVSMGFNVASGPEIESEYNNFDALNISASHPARDMHDTFYLPGGMILRTHTSPVQIRYMLANKPPVAIIAPGRVYRVDDVDATHSPVFHQLEGLLVDQGISMAHLKGTLQEFLQAMFGHGLATRFRPSFFPFTEPSAEVDVQCFSCRTGKSTCRVCKGTGWIEIGGAGMVHPKVLENVGYDPRRVSGFAFGLGIDRFAMLRYGIDSLRPFFENDIRFLKQFAG